MTRQFDLQGHRGARGLYPENTLAGFAGAVAIGVDTLELDVAMTADEVVVVCHDPALNPDIARTSDGVWLARHGPLIRQLRLAELERYDVGRIRPGSDYAALFPDQVPHDGARVPTLAAVMRSLPDTKLNIELKTFPQYPDIAADGRTMAEAVVAVADAQGATGRIIVQSFDWRGPRHLRRTRPDVCLAWLTRAAILAEARAWWDGPDPADYGGSVPRAVAAEGGTIWAPAVADLTEVDLAQAHALGLRVVPWTVNRPEDMRRLVRWGVDGLISDRPDLARAVLARAGLRLPPSGGSVTAG